MVEVWINSQKNQGFHGYKPWLQAASLLVQQSKIINYQNIYKSFISFCKLLVISSLT